MCRFKSDNNGILADTLEAGVYVCAYDTLGAADTVDRASERGVLSGH